MIEHPDHTGSSSNPNAPWNQPDAIPVQCVFCHEESETLEVGDDCEECGEEDAMAENQNVCDRHGYCPRGCPCDEY
jgi:hypothetical protein